MSAVVAQKKSVINWKSRSSPETEPIDVYIQIRLKELVQIIVSVASEICRTSSRPDAQVRVDVSGVRQNWFFWDRRFFSEGLQLVRRGLPP